MLYNASWCHQGFPAKVPVKTVPRYFPELKGWAKRKRKQVDLEKGRNIPELLVQFIISCYQLMTIIGRSVTEIEAACPFKTEGSVGLQTFFRLVASSAVWIWVLHLKYPPRSKSFFYLVQYNHLKCTFFFHLIYFFIPS